MYTMVWALGTAVCECKFGYRRHSQYGNIETETTSLSLPLEVEVFQHTPLLSGNVNCSGTLYLVCTNMNIGPLHFQTERYVQYE